jgi:hypothetical protein
MDFVGWMIDIAREQSPRVDTLAEIARRSAAAGYTALGLYLEHRFAYASAPWAAGPGCLTPDMLRTLRSALATPADGHVPARLRLIPFLNTLGHMEGFLRAEGGQGLAEGPAGFGGAQMCPSRAACTGFARDLVVDVLDAFDDEWVHLGGDEARQLGQCPQCAARLRDIGAGGLYAEYFAPLCRFVLERGRRPCVWGDMLLQHPETLAALPRETVIFDWQYYGPAEPTARRLRAAGFDVVCCPNIRTERSAWCLLPETFANVDAHRVAAAATGARGVLVTTWEYSLFLPLATLLPLIYAAGRRLVSGEDWTNALMIEGGAGYAAASLILGREIPAASAFLRGGPLRTFRDNFAGRLNPFYLWKVWRDACGAPGDEILRCCDAAEAQGGGAEALEFIIRLYRAAVAWCRVVERTRTAYVSGDVEAAVARLQMGVQILEQLRPGLQKAAVAGGSAADIERLDILLEKVARVSQRLLQTGSGAFRPAFETLIHDGYVPGDQAAWRSAAYD